MRVIAGSLKGRRLDTPDWPGLRPTSDRLRETLFNVLAPRIGGARFLDAFAGTGAVGIEALSRGAAHVTFVEEDLRAVRLIERNLSHCRIAGPPAHAGRAAASRGSGQERENRYAIIRAGFAAAARQMAPDFDLLFLDPPYGQDRLTGSLEAASRLVGPEALLVIEHARRDEAPENLSGLRRLRQLRSGDSALSFYDRHPDV